MAWEDQFDIDFNVRGIESIDRATAKYRAMRAEASMHLAHIKRSLADTDSSTLVAQEQSARNAQAQFRAEIQQRETAAAVAKMAADRSAFNSGVSAYTAMKFGPRPIIAPGSGAGGFSGTWERDNNAYWRAEHQPRPVTAITNNGLFSQNRMAGGGSNYLGGRAMAMENYSDRIFTRMQQGLFQVGFVGEQAFKKVVKVADRIAVAGISAGITGVGMAASGVRNLGVGAYNAMMATPRFLANNLGEITAGLIGAGRFTRNSVSAASPVTMQRFDKAQSDLMGQLGKPLIPLFDSLTQKIRNVADNVATMSPGEQLGTTMLGAAASFAGGALAFKFAGSVLRGGMGVLLPRAMAGVEKAIPNMGNIMAGKGVAAVGGDLFGKAITGGGGSFMGRMFAGAAEGVAMGATQAAAMGGGAKSALLAAGRIAGRLFWPTAIALTVDQIQAQFTGRSAVSLMGEAIFGSGGKKNSSIGAFDAKMTDYPSFISQIQTDAFANAGGYTATPRLGTKEYVEFMNNGAKPGMIDGGTSKSKNAAMSDAFYFPTM